MRTLTPQARICLFQVLIWTPIKALEALNVLSP